MALSDVGGAMLISAVTATLAKRTTDRAGFRSDVATLIHTRVPAVTLAQAAADLTSGKIVVLVDPLAGYVGFGRYLMDAQAAIKVKTG